MAAGAVLWPRGAAGAVADRTGPQTLSLTPNPSPPTCRVCRTALRCDPVLLWQVWAVIGCGAASSVGCQGSTLAVEKEWVKAMCQGDSALLGRRNAGARGMPPRSIL